MRLVTDHSQYLSVKSSSIFCLCWTSVSNTVSLVSFYILASFWKICTKKLVSCPPFCKMWSDPLIHSWNSHLRLLIWSANLFMGFSVINEGASVQIINRFHTDHVWTSLPCCLSIDWEPNLIKVPRVTMQLHRHGVLTLCGVWGWRREGEFINTVPMMMEH